MSDIGALEDFSPGVAHAVTAGGRRLVLVRIGDDVYVLDDRCSHEDFPLSEGEVDEAGGTIECARHGAAFSLATGEPESFPATQPVRRFEVTVQEGRVRVVSE
ncbi:MAG: non-heme iron oxygenase ferredoxin subunit [Acidimicrobiaceae bacterium]|nr:non-heme iron oxygenase ferredoxin subunit [Acidimicrobiaceae bacterium]